MDNTQIIKNFVEEVWNQNKPNMVSKYVDSNYAVHLLGGKRDERGIAWVQKNITDTHIKYPGFHIAIEDMVNDGDKIVSRLLLACDLGMTSREIVIHRILEGKIVEAWSLGSKWD